MADMENRISVAEYIADNSLLEAVYTPFNTKVGIVDSIVMNIAEQFNGINSTFLRRISTEIFIATITNIDMDVVDENGMNGYDQLCFANELEHLKTLIGNEYQEFEKILAETVGDYQLANSNTGAINSAIYKRVEDRVKDALVYVKDNSNDSVSGFVSGLIASVFDKTGGGDDEA